MKNFRANSLFFSTWQNVAGCYIAEMHFMLITVSNQFKKGPGMFA